MTFYPADYIQAGASDYPLPSGGSLSSVVTETGATFTATTSNDVILCNSAAITVSLPTSVGNTGKVFYIKNLHSTGIVTIDPTGVELVDGNLKGFVTTKNENVTLCSDNVGWKIL